MTDLQSTPLIVTDVGKSFVMHLRGSVTIPVVARVNFVLNAGECSVLGGPSGVGKSSILKMIYGNYGTDTGQILVYFNGRMLDLARADPRTILAVRREMVGYVSQFLRAMPRVPALDVAAEGLVEQGESVSSARERAGNMLARLNLPEKLWQLPPATFSGGEQQRVNIARGFLTEHPVLLLDEPTASLDAANRAIVIDLIKEKKRQGVALLGIFHDKVVRDAVADVIVDVSRFAKSVEDEAGLLAGARRVGEMTSLVG
ncbi:alpha-D-ribose 1-methylphosphonate 5-triphosphate synthase subunit PhnL [Cohaesibacter sp. ES.047]|uniref:phosphonate C-P lyase system protein PhnL n=1 Tax=Cohaesibacter sp. ES.047 TaxID=1798205 RepID=UPI000BB720BB|nr:phosphonate C-P lyase system protein PhnL [Cohaesibacter sp. ES.047]SNY92862.1 alpha-D-ribose 1-methylphosphonate 5-triphosphate synthase subunit PhnL [Cohaesibacter sp. ES.047]